MFTTISILNESSASPARVTALHKALAAINPEWALDHLSPLPMIGLLNGVDDMMWVKEHKCCIDTTYDNFIVEELATANLTNWLSAGSSVIKDSSGKLLNDVMDCFNKARARMGNEISFLGEPVWYTESVISDAKKKEFVQGAQSVKSEATLEKQNENTDSTERGSRLYGLTKPQLIQELHAFCESEQRAGVLVSEAETQENVKYTITITK